MSVFVQTRIDEKLHGDLTEIATEQFEGNLSMVVRMALREFRDRNKPEQATAPRHPNKTDPFERGQI